MAPTNFVSRNELEQRFGHVLKLDIGCGANPHPGYVGLDIQDFKHPAIIQADLETYPWPLPDSVFRFAIASHVAEHINPAHGGFLRWMNEVWRVLEVGAHFVISAPYGVNDLFLQDPTHCNPITERKFWYFDPLHSSGFYRFYRPRPWKILDIAIQKEGFIEVAVEKRAEDPSYAR
jgi:hypothetical protein